MHQRVSRKRDSVGALTAHTRDRRPARERQLATPERVGHVDNRARDGGGRASGLDAAVGVVERGQVGQVPRVHLAVEVGGEAALLRPSARRDPPADDVGRGVQEQVYESRGGRAAMREAYTVS